MTCEAKIQLQAVYSRNFILHLAVAAFYGALLAGLFRQFRYYGINVLPALLPSFILNNHNLH